MTKDEFITVEEAAAILRVNERTIKTMIKNGKLPAKDINATGTQRKIYRILKSDIYLYQIDNQSEA